MLVGKILLLLLGLCHRVIHSNGEIRGYSAPGGAIAKKVLLEKESS
jgi:O6-methylguanine-DNA--protein-cysteine methyltransferase